MRPLRVGIVGLGIAGTTTAILLARDGHDVTVMEEAVDPAPMGAGIWLQECGQEVLDRLGLLDALAARSRTISEIRLVGARGRVVAQLSYDVLPQHRAALGVHRGNLFEVLYGSAQAEPLITIHTGHAVTDVHTGVSGATIATSQRNFGPFDLIIGADGRHSRVRAALRLTTRHRPYEWGAWWAVVDDPHRIAERELFQAVQGTRQYLGVLPTGAHQASLFWSVRWPHGTTCTSRPAPDPDLSQWRERARPLADRYVPLLEQVTGFLPASYCDVVTQRTYRARTDGGRTQAAVLLGDAAHAMSPQLGVGATMALADAWSLAHCLRTHHDVVAALRDHESRRRAHVRWYQFCSRAMMPVFQSSWDALAYPRDFLGPVLSRPRAVQRLAIRQVLGNQTSLVGAGEDLVLGR